jgi:hypothetical protein
MPGALMLWVLGEIAVTTVVTKLLPAGTSWLVAFVQVDVQLFATSCDTLLSGLSLRDLCQQLW